MSNDNIAENAALYLERAAWALRAQQRLEKELYAYSVAWSLLSLAEKRKIYEAMDAEKNYAGLSSVIINRCSTGGVKP